MHTRTRLSFPLPAGRADHVPAAAFQGPRRMPARIDGEPRERRRRLAGRRGPPTHPILGLHPSPRHARVKIPTDVDKYVGDAIHSRLIAAAHSIEAGAPRI